MAVYSWAFPLLETAPEMDGKTDVVVTVHWRLEAEDDFANCASQGGQITIGYNPEDPFVPFAQLTPETVEGWLSEKINIDALKATLDASLTRKAPPPALQPKPPPWGA